jgi:hypothetical protein
MSHRSILARLVESGLHASRVRLRNPASSAQDPVSPEPGDRHVLLGEIGRDETGVVRRGHDVDLGRDVAVKLLQRRRS